MEAKSYVDMKTERFELTDDELGNLEWTEKPSGTYAAEFSFIDKHKKEIRVILKTQVNKVLSLLEPELSPYEIPHAAVDKYFTPPGPPADKVEAVAKLLAIQTLEDESLAAPYVWQWVIDNGFVEEYFKKAREILKLIDRGE